jgi:hypothetical protein
MRQLIIMTNELSNKVEINGKAILRMGAPKECTGILDGCHAEPVDAALYQNDLYFQLGVLAAKAGYKLNEEFEYTVIVKKKQ